MFTLAFLLLLYFLPSIIAHNKRDTTAILLLNFFFGWTGIGWLMALVWACASEPSSYVRMVPVPVAGRFCCQCGNFAHPGTHFCTACGRTV